MATFAQAICQLQQDIYTILDNPDLADFAVSPALCNATEIVALCTSNRRTAQLSRDWIWSPTAAAHLSVVGSSPLPISVFGSHLAFAQTVAGKKVQTLPDAGSTSTPKLRNNSSVTCLGVLGGAS
jgi:hypothetical protein